MADTLRVVRATSLEVDRLSREMRDFKAEMSAFKDEMRAFKDEMSAFKDEMSAFKDEMKVFKDEMNAFTEETRNERREMNKRWGELAASLGTFVEDIVAPSIPRVLREVFDCLEEDITFSAVRLKRKHPTLPDRNREFDTVTAGCGYFLTVESKIRLDIAAVNEFADRMPEVKEYFPEFAARGYRFVGAVASLNVDPSVVTFAEKRGLIVLGTGEDLMTVLNSPGFVPRAY
ncbi:MAG: hypothetical protein KatS3mg053_0196 [Candidatus Roseilinea sp.]|nr:MAG: hypothetical protein KatS3mg053_0196 [Candidatus Roseilinea sp.]